jgi:TolB protein
MTFARICRSWFFTADTIWEAPNWSPDGKYLISNSGGLIYKLIFKADGTVQTPEKAEYSP